MVAAGRRGPTDRDAKQTGEDNFMMLDTRTGSDEIKGRQAGG